MGILEDLEGIDLSDELKEIIVLEEQLAEEEDENIKLYGTVRRLNMKLKEKDEEISELKEQLAELDPEFGDIYYGSDRGNEMRNE